MNSDTSILVYKFRPERTGFNMYAEYTRPQITFHALVPWVGLCFKKDSSFIIVENPPMKTDKSVILYILIFIIFITDIRKLPFSQMKYKIVGNYCL